MPNICQVFLYILMLDNYFSYAMILCTIQGSPKVHFFFLSDFLFLEILMREIFFVRWSN
jgi:hypothetical protein